MKIILGADHAGFDAKERLKAALIEEGYEIRDAGTAGKASCDYPDFAAAVARSVSAGEADRGILVCGTGIGMSIAANKVKGIRAAVCHDRETARMSRAHNDANILCMGARVITVETMLEMIREWLAVRFESGRHARRLDKIRSMEEDRP
jgi:RpiB/LacA/LacB family sugar-phosphate isomerase